MDFKIKFFSATPLILLYLSIIFLSMIVPELPNYNPYLYLASCIVLLYYERRAVTYLFAFFLAVFVAVFSFWNNVRILYILIDAGVIFYVVSSIDIVRRLRIKPKTMVCLWWILFMLTVVSVLNIANPNAYSENLTGEVRYYGIFEGRNSSASIFLIFQILLWETYKKIYKQGWRTPLLLFFIITFVIYAFASRTRTMLFASPYWIYQLYENFGKKFFFIGLISLIIAAESITLYMQENFRMEKDDSYNTRAALYAVQIAGVVENYGLIPHGSGTSNVLVKNFTGDDEYSPHNDFLRYIYDWGAAFWIMLIFLIIKLRQVVHANFEFFLILFAYSGFALHNLLFLPYVWLPFIFILTLLTKTKIHDEKNVSRSKKI